MDGGRKKEKMYMPRVDQSLVKSDFTQKTEGYIWSAAVVFAPVKYK